MRVGVVCEGPTDFHAIKHFLGHSLQQDGIEVTFIDIHPKIDNTQPEGGWGNVLLWLDKNPPATRIARYFGGGFFADELSEPPFDGILVHLDGDIIGEASFTTYLETRYCHNPGEPRSPGQKGQAIRDIIEVVGRFAEMTLADVRRHIIAPAIESTENWCIAAFTAASEDFEQISGQDLVNRFMAALAVCEGKLPSANYAEIDKQQARRAKFCATHAAGSNRIRAGCSHFAHVCQDLADIANEAR